MLKMKLLVKTAEEGGDTVEGEQEKSDCNFHPFNPPLNTASYNGSAESDRRRGCHPLQLDKETVFEWFGLHLSPAKRIEFMCGLLHMCQPLELRFLGACLEDLARKDFHVLRDFEIRANSHTELAHLIDVTDPVVLSKLLVCLSLLGSENRECAGTVFRTLSHIDSALHLRNYVVQPPHGAPRHPARTPCEPGADPSSQGHPGPGPSEPGYLEQLALLCTMASAHPAFPFHQREAVRLQLEFVHAALREQRRHCRGTSPGLVTSQFSGPDYLCPHAEQPAPASPLSGAAHRPVVHVAKIVLKEISGVGNCRQYRFEVKWSDSSSTAVTKSHRQLEDFLLQLTERVGVEAFEKGILSLLRQGDQCDPRDLERRLRERFLAAPMEVLQATHMRHFFSSATPTCSQCSGAAGGRPRPPPTRRQQEEEETSSLEEEVDAAGRCGVKPASFSAQHSESFLRDGGMSGGQGQNGGMSWRAESPSGRRGRPSCPADTVQCCSQASPTPSLPQRSKTRPAGKRRGKAAKGSLPNGLQRPSAAQISQGGCKGRDTYGDTSSESSAPSSPQHRPRSRESRPAEERDTDSQSDNSAQEMGNKSHQFHAVGGKVVAMVNPMVTGPEACAEEGAVPTPAVVQLALTSCLPYALRYGSEPPGPTTGGSKLTITIPVPPPESLPTPPAESEPPPPPQVPLGAISVHPPCSVCQPPLPPACPNPNPSLGPTPPCSKPPASSGSAPLPTYTASQVQGLLPACPPPPTHTHTHTPSPGAVLSPAHSTPQTEPLPHTCPSLPITAQAPPQAQSQQQIGCNTCGCRGSCGSTHQHPNYFLPPQLARQVFAPPPTFFHLPPSLCNTSFPTAQGHQSNGTPPLPFYPGGAAPGAFGSTAPLLHSEHVLAAQPGYGLPQMPHYSRFYPPLYPPLGLLPGATGMKKGGGSVSCYNCGMSGHIAQDCKQPTIDAGQSGGFRLKYVAPHSSESQDKTD